MQSSGRRRYKRSIRAQWGIEMSGNARRQSLSFLVKYHHDFEGKVRRGGTKRRCETKFLLKKKGVGTSLAIAYRESNTTIERERSKWPKDYQKEEKKAVFEKKRKGST